MSCWASMWLGSERKVALVHRGVVTALAEDRVHLVICRCVRRGRQSVGTDASDVLGWQLFI